jgi:hypothetical protein
LKIVANIWVTVALHHLMPLSSQCKAWSRNTPSTRQAGVQDVPAGEPVRIRLPGNSRDEIELEAATPATKLRRIHCCDLARTADDLRSRSLTVKTGNDAVSVTDPDGVVILFSLKRHEP